MRISFAMLAIVLTIMYCRSQGFADVMVVCELSHSHDTCFQTLNR